MTGTRAVHWIAIGVVLAGAHLLAGATVRVSGARPGARLAVPSGLAGALARPRVTPWNAIKANG